LEDSVRIALADDHKLFRETLRDMLKTEPGFQVVAEAENGLSAIEKVQKHRPDIVLMDVKMPVMNGIDATRQITLQFPETKVIALSLDSDCSTVEKMRQAGATGYLPKVCSRNDLIETIYRVHRELGLSTLLSASCRPQVSAAPRNVLAVRDLIWRRPPHTRRRLAGRGMRIRRPWRGRRLRERREALPAPLLRTARPWPSSRRPGPRRRSAF
jgi:DNA-binding NarL/FixJ family response regulator